MDFFSRRLRFPDSAQFAGDDQVGAKTAPSLHLAARFAVREIRLSIGKKKENIFLRHQSQLGGFLVGVAAHEVAEEGRRHVDLLGALKE
jgi:hypothetical protein